MERWRSAISEIDPEPAGLLEEKFWAVSTVRMSRMNGSHAVLLLCCGVGRSLGKGDFQALLEQEVRKMALLGGQEVLNNSIVSTGDVSACSKERPLVVVGCGGGEKGGRTFL